VIEPRQDPLHVPPVQLAPAGQAIAQPPQFEASVVVSTHAPLHRVIPPAQPPGAQAPLVHTPEQQLEPAAQAAPAGSQRRQVLPTHVPEQFCGVQVAPTTQEPPEHVVPAGQLPHRRIPPQPSGVGPQAIPFCAQVSGVQVGRVQAPFWHPAGEQQSELVAQAAPTGWQVVGAQAPFVHAAPDGQTTPQPPQFMGSLVVSTQAAPQGESPGPHTPGAAHTPPPQTWPRGQPQSSVPPQPSPSWPQFFPCCASPAHVCGTQVGGLHAPLTHDALQQSEACTHALPMGEHAALQAPFTHAAPLGQTTPPPPQFIG
jgi:hypothetical protein